jgi:hypothetical protein
MRDYQNSGLGFVSGILIILLLILLTILSLRLTTASIKLIQGYLKFRLHQQAFSFSSITEGASEIRTV